MLTDTLAALIETHAAETAIFNEQIARLQAFVTRRKRWAKAWDNT